MTHRTSDAQVTVKPHDTAGVDPATVAADLSFAAVKLSQENAYRRGLERAAEIVSRGACPGSCFHERCRARKNIAAAIRAEIGTLTR